jgi:hypothetical protein
MELTCPSGVWLVNYSCLYAAFSVIIRGSVIVKLTDGPRWKPVSNTSMWSVYS